MTTRPTVVVTAYVDLDAARSHGVPVANIPDHCIDAVADHTLRSLSQVVIAPHIASVSPTAVKALRQGAAARALAAALGRLPPTIANGVDMPRALG